MRGGKLRGRVRGVYARCVYTARSKSAKRDDDGAAGDGETPCLLHNNIA